MNILLVSYIYPKKSNARRGIFVHQRAKYIARAGHDVSVITTSGPGDSNFGVKDNVRIYRVSETGSIKPLSGLFFIVKTLAKILELSKRNKPDYVVQEFMGISTIFIGAILKIIGIKFALISHGSKWEMQTRSPIRRMLIRLAMYFPEKSIFVSRNIMERLAPLCSKSKPFVVNNGMDPEYLAPSKKAADFKKEIGTSSKQILLTVSNLVSKKGIDVIIRAFANISARNKDIAYIIVGEGPEKENLAALIKELKLENKIILEDKKIGSKLADYYNACDVFVVMSRDIDDEVESFGIVYLEAAYFGKPVVGGISGGTADAVVNNVTGFLIDSSDQKKLEETLVLLLKDKKLRERLGKSGRKRVLEGFLWSHSAKKLLQILGK